MPCPNETPRRIIHCRGTRGRVMIASPKASWMNAIWATMLRMKTLSFPTRCIAIPREDPIVADRPLAAALRSRQKESFARVRSTPTYEKNR